MRLHYISEFHKLVTFQFYCSKNSIVFIFILMFQIFHFEDSFDIFLYIV